MPKIKGTIIQNDYQFAYDYFGIEATSPARLEKELGEARGQPVTVEINSPGGYLTAGVEMYDIMQRYEGDLTIDIVGQAGSAASVAAMARKCRMTVSGLLMIHNVSGGVSGDYHDMDKTSEALQVANKAVSNAYQAKTGKSTGELLALMDAETWMDAEKALEEGFIDEIIQPKAERLFNSSGVIIPEATIEKLKNTLKGQSNDRADFFISKLNFLKLKGQVN